MYGYLSTAIFIFCFIHQSFLDTSVNINANLESYDFLFDNAVEAYYKADWMSVILNMERALRNKGAIRRVRAHCRLSCANQTAFAEPIPGLGLPIPGTGFVEDLGFFHNILKRADCVNSCESEKLGPPSKHIIGEEVELEFQKRSPYNYLQVAYFKINKLDKAVAAAYTFYLANPDHLEMRQNLDYYRQMVGVQETDFKDLEAMLHMSEFLEGKNLYSEEQFVPAIEHFESAVMQYFAADLECRALCEGPYDYDGYNYMDYKADLFQAITDHYVQVLNCKQNCAVELATVLGSDKPLEDFLPSHFNYLQFAYYNSNIYDKAIECARTYLLFYPDDEVMNQNLAYYSTVLGEEKAASISAREAVHKHIRQSLLEKELLYYAYEVFGITFVDSDLWTPAEVMPPKLREKQKVERETAARITEEIGNLMKEIETLVEEKSKDSTDIVKMVREGGSVLYDDITVSMTSKSLNGTERVVLDGVITNDECRELHRLSNAAALAGDGYRGKPSPHTPSETFQGITVLKALKMGQEGKIPLNSAELYFNLSEKVRKVLESYFRLESPLYFSYTHLVCRSAIDDKQEGRNDLSHPVHADNCQLISELNECIKEPPAYTERDYSGILYLNDDFEGGDFIFTELDAKTVTAKVRPRCGRVVGFEAGKENPHGVTAVTKGQRCAIALWFTLDPRHNEKDRIQAEDLLKMLTSPVDAEFQGSPVDSSAGTTADLQSARGGEGPGQLVQQQASNEADQQPGKEHGRPAAEQAVAPTNKEDGGAELEKEHERPAAEQATGPTNKEDGGAELEKEHKRPAAEQAVAPTNKEDGGAELEKASKAKAKKAGKGKQAVKPGSNSTGTRTVSKAEKKAVKKTDKQTSAEKAVRGTSKSEGMQPPASDSKQSEEAPSIGSQDQESEAAGSQKDKEEL